MREQLDFQDVDVINHEPSAPDDHKTTSKDTPVSGKVEVSDPDGDPLTYNEGNPPSHGTVEVHYDGTWTYTPDMGYTGNDSFTIIVDDGKCGRIEVPVTVDITEPENPPTAPDEHKTTSKDTPVSGKVKGSDPDGDSLTYKEGKPPSHGTVEVREDGTWTYTPDKGYTTGNDSFTVIVEDGKGGKIEVPVKISITETNNPPSSGDNHNTSNNPPESEYVKGPGPDGKPLPKTGDTNSFATIMGGIVLLLAGGILSLRIKRRKNA
ncbi:tandem-95 repeat protein [Bacillus sp. APMAM]|nr:tandem-95 repeat protein [Bacillus sp. APMAM]RTZ56617.1 tandem-95 repeat protein [Bacillus sp. SAJ1]